MNLYERYLNIKSSGSLEDRILVMSEIIRQNPKLMDYIETKIDSCYGTHIVYLVYMKVNGKDMLKIGYTKNSVEGRFGEKRYAGRDSLEIIEIQREQKLQAKGAIEFEKELKKRFKDYQVKSDLTLPGKGEFYDIMFLDEMVKIYDDEYPKYISVVGLKLPINIVIGEKKYEIMLRFFKKELKKFDFYENDNGVIYCLDINSKEWIFVDKNNQRDFFYSRKYFSNFLFRVFDLLEDGEYMNEQLVKRLIFDCIDTLNEIYYNKHKDHYWESIILYASFTRKLVILKDSLELMFKELEFEKSGEYGGFIKS